MKALIAIVFGVFLVTGSNVFAECVTGTVMKVKDPLTVTIVCKDTADLIDVPLYGLKLDPVRADQAMKFLESELVGRSVRCFSRGDRENCSFYVTFQEGGSFQNRYLLTGHVYIDEDTCVSYICNDMKKYEEFATIAKR
ncbi:MAG: hypothetical protein ACLFTB_04890 [Desulfovibrionales bacterium]